MKRLVRMIVSRTTLILLLLLAQIALFFVLVEYVSNIGDWSIAFYTVSIIIVIYLVAKEENPYYKISWIIPILVFPLFGGLFYLFYRQRNLSSKVLQRHLNIDLNRYDYVHTIENKLKTKKANYLDNQNWPAYSNTKTDFLASGEAMFEAMLKDIQNAKKYIFLEFFIISPGEMWDSLLKVLREKIKEGLDVKLVFDDFGSSALPFRYEKKLRKMGFDVINFNPMRIHLNFAMNYRDHRKIVVIDGNVGYTGGINIGDEYINKISPFGHWLDAGIRIEGKAVWSLVISFLETYRFMGKKDIDYEHYKGDLVSESDGYVAPFGDTPLDKELTTKNMYLSMLSAANTSIDITTPYLIIDNELNTALKLAAKSGVKVRIIIPHVPDKRIVYMVTESYVPELIQAGCNVYRYEPGFIHSKMMIVDNNKAMIGTANLDFRSLYLHFENSVFLDGCQTINEMTKFFDSTIEKSICITKSGKRNIIYRLIQVMLKGFSTLM
ncbi:MAG: cardiolipin synthase [Tenericutes bacterium HGW-Tenericutes-2]|nr:MAG: cardiolipin synthase [Tenericutes bacterium HGW-Tenericutes-2]